MSAVDGAGKGPDGLTNIQRAARNKALDTMIIRHHDLPSFCKRAWQIIEPGRVFYWNWHMQKVCEHGLVPISEGRLKRLVICVPPRTTKSTLVSVLWPAWDWIRNPWRYYMSISKSSDLSTKHSRQMRAIIRSDWYQGILAKNYELDPSLPQWTISKDKDSTRHFVNTYGGGREGLGIGDAVTGKGADIQIIDDPLDAKQVVNGSSVQIANRLTECNNTIDIVLPTRLNDPQTSARVIVMQRLAHDDPAGFAIRRGWTCLNFPMEYDPSHESGTAHDIRTEPGELLFPARFPPHIVEEYRAALGARHYDAQYGQNPSPSAGALFKRSWFLQVYRFDPLRPPHDWDQCTMSVDAAFKGKVDSDYVAIQVWGRKGPNMYLLDQIHDRMNYPETKAAIKRMRARHPRVKRILIEDKANGPALISELGLTIPGIIAFDPGKNSKQARANAASVFWEAGNCYLPEPDAALFDVGRFVEECLRFQDGAIHDDQVDAMAQFILDSTGGMKADPRERLRNNLGFMKKYAGR